MEPLFIFIGVVLLFVLINAIRGAGRTNRSGYGSSGPGFGFFGADNSLPPDPLARLTDDPAPPHFSQDPARPGLSDDPSSHHSETHHHLPQHGDGSSGHAHHDPHDGGATSSFDSGGAASSYDGGSSGSGGFDSGSGGSSFDSGSCGSTDSGGSSS